MTIQVSYLRYQITLMVAFFKIRVAGSNRKKNQLQVPENSVIVGDDAFSLKEYMMKPYTRQVNQCLKERVYNYRHCCARRIVENAFGILASRFRIFQRVIDLKTEKVVKIVKADSVLHNWIMKK